ncbi:sigma-70 family RNA polymerase sigma factor [Sphingobacterium alkalisoli]|uniref:Sigma-70 family RNA polymerase sigma factor n=1 Tax=Sphingobacterium alkalisoli TaxID=1874115 RepID=A0A4U0GSR0_9SPHI|nr:sigma-70 family RNA polymerase sigma factor [Sphingobacterium alkalisoli]TJY61504.1 sigma-70 family RNA polymerase sigma factor [Sphingobacterium alkalisoli]GGH29986.1 RNA polymerase sigma-70 factor [Sphingobacterium alkalisoli]
MAKYGSQCTDEMLLDLIQQEDDRTAFAKLYDRYWKMLIDMVGKRGLSMESAEEIVQNVFVDLYLRRKSIKVNSLEAYLRAAVKYQLYKTYRAQQVHNNYVSSAIYTEQTQPLTPDKALETKQLQEEISRTTEKMSSVCRDVFLLSRIDQLSNQDIAYKLGISLSMVRKHITKSMNIMRAQFKGYPINLILACMLFF